MNQLVPGEYAYEDDGPSYGHRYLLGAVRDALKACRAPPRIFEVGCGNGSMAEALAADGYEVIGVDTSVSGIAIANRRGVGRFEVASANEDLAARFGVFDVVLCLEVLEHLYDPRSAARAITGLLSNRGSAIVSVPYHGYFKNLAVAASGRFDRHFSPLWDHGHIKFWSRTTLRALFAEVGLAEQRFRRVGRIPPLGKSMVATFGRP